MCLFSSNVSAQGMELFWVRLSLFLSEFRQLTQERQAVGLRLRDQPRAVRAQAEAAWTLANRSRLDSLQRLARELAVNAPQPLFSLIDEVEIPEEATPEFEEFLVSSAFLYNSFAQLKNTIRAAGVEERRQAVQLFTNEHSELLEEHYRLTKAVARQAAEDPPPLPSALNLPENCSPQWRTFYTELHELTRERAELHHRILNSAPAEQRQILNDWNVRNAPRQAEVHRLARQLAEQ